MEAYLYQNKPAAYPTLKERIYNLLLINWQECCTNQKYDLRKVTQETLNAKVQVISNFTLLRLCDRSGSGSIKVWLGWQLYQTFNKPLAKAWNSKV